MSRFLARWTWTAFVVSSVALFAVIASWRPPGPTSAGTLPITEGVRRKTFAGEPIVHLSMFNGGAPVGTHPAGAERLPADQSVPPVSVRVDGLGIDVPVVSVGVEPGTGAMSVPPDGGVVGWYQYGPSPGETGSAVLAGHVDFDGRPGAFFELRRVEPGATVVVRTADGAERNFVVQGRAQIAKAELPVSELFSRTGPTALVLVTCGGSYDRATRSYAANVVIYAVPA